MFSIAVKTVSEAQFCSYDQRECGILQNQNRNLDTVLYRNALNF